MTIRGLDAASWQGVVNWEMVAASGREFAILKASEGATYRNPFFSGNWVAAKAAGLARGAYCYAQPDRGAPEAQAAYFLDAVGPLAEGDVLALDLEAGTGDVSAWALAWLQAVEARAGFKPLLYSGRWFMDAHGITGNTAFAPYGLWIAAYQKQAPTAPAPWDFWAVWQNSEMGSVPGVAGLCDTDVLNADSVERFTAYGKPASAGRAFTNDDFTQSCRFMLAQPPDLAGLRAYLEEFN